MHVTADVTFQETEYYYSGGVPEHPLQGESSIFAEDTQIIQSQQQSVMEQCTQQPTEIPEVHELEAADAPNDDSDNTTPTQVPSSLIQSAPEASLQVIEHSNSSSSTSPELNHTENTTYQLPHRTTRRYS
ncbi:hypothetical protein GCM10007933_43310 [Zoogloea oryzae]|uniref:Uncharacterized protein n=1 Tax=Zoogloea oryzae TaxID=310767 RepID=A0ABQ6FHU2_9RHOO|nr:hypothetical protein GCM10007933_43310 [Zoogloea oryzae]